MEFSRADRDLWVPSQCSSTWLRAGVTLHLGQTRWCQQRWGLGLMVVVREMGLKPQPGVCGAEHVGPLALGGTRPPGMA